MIHAKMIKISIKTALAFKWWFHRVFMIAQYNPHAVCPVPIAIRGGFISRLEMSWSWWPATRNVIWKSSAQLTPSCRASLVDPPEGLLCRLMMKSPGVKRCVSVFKINTCKAPTSDISRAFSHLVSMKLGVASIKSNMTCRPRRAGQARYNKWKGYEANFQRHL